MIAKARRKSIDRVHPVGNTCSTYKKKVTFLNLVLNYTALQQVTLRVALD